MEQKAGKYGIYDFWIKSSPAKRKRHPINLVIDISCISNPKIPKWSNNTDIINSPAIKAVVAFAIPITGVSIINIVTKLTPHTPPPTK